MKVGEATSRFIAVLQQRDHRAHPLTGFENSAIQALDLLDSHFASILMADLTPAKLRDFLARWYVEEASAKRLQSLHSDSIQQAVNFPSAKTFIESLSAFFKWIQETATNPFASAHLEMLNELHEAVPRAIEISVALMRHVASRGGAFNFPEFLSSFEEGGHSEYDVGAGGAVGAIEGYFRLLRIEGAEVEAEELITESAIFPIIFPRKVAELLQPNYLINLEIIHISAVWQIVGGGFAYPPNTEI